MLLSFFTPQGVTTLDPLTATDAQWAALNIPPSERDAYRHQAELAHEFNDKHIQALLALEHWDTLSLAQKDTILKNLLAFTLFKEGYL